VKFDGVSFEITYVAEFSTNGICQVAAKEKTELIIMATHGRTGLKHVLIGSMAEAVVRHAPCPVLVVPSHPETRTLNVRKRSARYPSMPKPARKLIPEALTTRRARKILAKPFPERRQTNKFRKSHLALRG
jgi:hypothetical protein